jgi:hypothetical protein
METIWGKLNTINRSCFPPFLPVINFTPWWTPELNTMRKQVNAAKHRVKRCKNPILKEIYYERHQHIRHKYKLEFPKAKKESWETYCMESTKESPWKIYKHAKIGFTGKPLPTTLTLEDRSSTSTDTETATALLNKFFPDDLPELDSPEQANIRIQTKCYDTPGNHPEPAFTNAEVEDIITNLKRSKCPGKDGIDADKAINILKTTPNFWHALFNKCLLKGHFPKPGKRLK